MPLYEFKCGECDYQFEELMGRNAGDEVPCKSCGKTAKRIVSRFSSKVAGGATNETIDMSIGRAANQRWQDYHDRQSKRRSGRELQDIPVPQSDGKFQPVMALGSKTDREKRTEYVDALQDHRKRRMEKGIPQFNGPGEF